MKKTKHLYDFDDYKDYLRHKAEAERGLKASLASALSCQSAYISQVLNGHAHLSLEQADCANIFFKHSDKESLFFLLLLQRDRAGTVHLKDFFVKQLLEFREMQLSYLNRRDIKNSLSEKDQAIYYSSWEYNAIHMAVTIPRLRTKESLARAFAISEDKVNHCLEFLLQTNLIKRSGDLYLSGTSENYLQKSSPFVRQLHLNTRVQAMRSLDREKIEDAHYSAVFTLSSKDVVRIKKLINESLAEVVGIAKDSKEEHICGLAIDFFDYEKA